MSEERIYYLLNAYTNKTATYAEEQELLQWAATTNNNIILKKYIHHLIETQTDEKFPEVNWENLYDQILQQADKNKQTKVRYIKWYKIAAAAVLAFIVVSGIYLLSHKKKQTPLVVENSTKLYKNNIQPGETKAILRAGNRQVILNKKDTSFTLAGNTVHINSGDVKIADVKPVRYTLITPRGGEYRLMLSDGTKVWLNADSKLIYPSVFTGNTREVSLTGEAYFEVSPHPASPKGRGVAMPFIVNSKNQKIEVLGTEFNVNAYPDEANIITTLVNGKVQVKSSKRRLQLEPGQQAILRQAQDDKREIILVENADVEQAVAWKNGYFRFDKADIHTIMKQLARWYDIKVSYSDNLPKHYFGAIMNRDNNISQILKMLEATGDVHFKIEGKEVRVME